MSNTYIVRKPTDLDNGVYTKPNIYGATVENLKAVKEGDKPFHRFTIEGINAEFIVDDQLLKIDPDQKSVIIILYPNSNEIGAGGSADVDFVLDSAIETDNTNVY